MTTTSDKRNPNTKSDGNELQKQREDAKPPDQQLRIATKLVNDITNEFTNHRELLGKATKEKEEVEKRIQEHKDAIKDADERLRAAKTKETHLKEKVRDTNPDEQLPTFEEESTYIARYFENPDECDAELLKEIKQQYAEEKQRLTNVPPMRTVTIVASPKSSSV